MVLGGSWSSGVLRMVLTTHEFQLLTCAPDSSLTEPGLFIRACFPPNDFGSVTWLTPPDEWFPYLKHGELLRASCCPRATEFGGTMSKKPSPGNYPIPTKGTLSAEGA